jgi:selenide,water dikinase
VKDDAMKYGFAVVGSVHPKRFTPNSGARPDDRFILTKPVGIGV